MHFVGARFTDLQTASTALGEIRASVAVAPGDLAVRPLGTTHYDAPTEDIVLAGRFAPDDVEAVVEILEAHGGAILARRPESTTVQMGGTTVDAEGTSENERRPPQGAAARDTRARTAERPQPRAGTPHKRVRRPATLLRGRAARDRRIRS